VKTPFDLREEAAGWCARLARDRSQSSWAIRFTHADIESSHATQLAWQAHCVIKKRLGRETPPQVLWAEAEALLRSGWGSHVILTAPKAKPTTTPTRAEEQTDMAKKQTRRTISVSRAMYDRAKTFSTEKGISLSQLTEVALEHALENFYRDSVQPRNGAVR
jgi:hypothetical protein